MPLPSTTLPQAPLLSGETGSSGEDGDARTVLSDFLVGKCNLLAWEDCSYGQVSTLLFCERELSANRQHVHCYQHTQGLAMDLAQLFGQRRFLFRFLSRYSLRNYSDRRTLFPVQQRAVDISSQTIAMGEVGRRTHQKLSGTFASVLTTRHSDVGLLPLVKCSSEVLHHLLKLITSPTDDQLSTQQLSLPSPPQYLLKTPLLPYVSQRILALIEPIDLMSREGPQQLQEALINDTTIGRVLKSPASQAFQRRYCVDHIVKTMVSGELSRDKLAAVGVLEHWVRLECDTDLMSHCHCLLVQERTSADALFGIASAVAQLGSQWTEDDLQQYGDFSEKFCSNFVMKAAEQLWEYLLSLSREEDDWSWRANQFVQAFQAIEPVASSPPSCKQLTVLLSGNMARQLELMRMAHTCFGCLDAATARRLLSALPAMARRSDANVSVLQCFVQHCVSLIVSEEVRNKTSLVVTLAEVVLLWLAAIPQTLQQYGPPLQHIKKSDLACILQILNCRGLPPDTIFPKEAGMQILTSLSEKLSHQRELTLAINEELSHSSNDDDVIGCYTPPDYPGPSFPVWRQQLACLLFWNRVAQLQKEPLIRLQSRLDDYHHSYSRITDVIDAQAGMRALLDKLVNLIVKWDTSIGADIMADGEFGEILSSLVNEFHRNSRHELYLLNAVIRCSSRVHLIQCLQSSTHPWARRVAGELAQSDSTMSDSLFSTKGGEDEEFEGVRRTTELTGDVATAGIEDESNRPSLLDPDTVQDTGDVHQCPATDDVSSTGDLGEMLLGEKDPVTEAVTLSLEECFSGPALISQTNSSPRMDWTDSDVNWELSQELDKTSLLEAVAMGSVHMSMTSQPGIVEPAPTLQPVTVATFALHREGRDAGKVLMNVNKLRSKAREKCQLECPAILSDDFGRVLEGSNMPPPTGKIYNLHVHTEEETMTVTIEETQRSESTDEDAASSVETTTMEMKFVSTTSFSNILKSVLCHRGLSSSIAGLHCGDGVLVDPDKPLSSNVQENPGPVRLFLVLGGEARSAMFSQSSDGMPSPPKRPILLSHLSQLLPASQIPLVLRPNPHRLPQEDSVIFAVPRQCLCKVMLESDSKPSITLVVLGKTPLSSVHAMATRYAEVDVESTALLCNGSPVPSTLSVQSLSSNTETITLSLSAIPESRSLQIELPSKETAPFKLTSSTTVKDIVDHLMKEQSLADSSFCLVDRLTMCSLPPSHVVNTSWLLRPSPQLALLPLTNLCPVTLWQETGHHGYFESTKQIMVDVSPASTVHQLLAHLQWIEGWSDLFQSNCPPVVSDACYHILLPNALPLGRMQLQGNLPLLLSVRPSTSINPVALSIVHGEAAPLTVQTDSPDVPIGNVITFLAPLLHLSMSDCLLVSQHGESAFEFICDDRRAVSLVVADLQAANEKGPQTFVLHEDSSYLAQKKVTVNIALLSDPGNEIATLSLLLSTELPSLLEQAREALKVTVEVDDLDLLVQSNETNISWKKRFLMLNLRQMTGRFGRPLHLLLQVPCIDVEVMPIGGQEGSVKLQLPSSLSLMDMAHIALGRLGVEVPLENFNLEINDTEVDEDVELSLHACTVLIPTEDGDDCLRVQFVPKEKALAVIVRMKDTPDVSKKLQLYPWTPLEKLAEDALLALNVQADVKEVRTSMKNKQNTNNKET